MNMCPYCSIMLRFGSSERFHMSNLFYLQIYRLVCCGYMPISSRIVFIIVRRSFFGCNVAVLIVNVLFYLYTSNSSLTSLLVAVVGFFFCSFTSTIHFILFIFFLKNLSASVDSFSSVCVWFFFFFSIFIWLRGFASAKFYKSRVMAKKLFLSHPRH